MADQEAPRPPLPDRIVLTPVNGQVVATMPDGTFYSTQLGDLIAGNTGLAWQSVEEILSDCRNGAIFEIPMHRCDPGCPDWHPEQPIDDECRCTWCPNPSDGVVDHPKHGEEPCCHRCATLLRTTVHAPTTAVQPSMTVGVEAS